MLRNAALSLLAAMTLAAAGPAPAAPVGEVTAVVGTPRAVAPDGRERPLRCGDVIADGERVVTPASSSVGVLVDGRLAELPEASSARLHRAAGGSAGLTLEAGRVRVLAPDADAAPLELAAASARTRVARGDVEAAVLPEKLGPTALLCTWGEPLDVVRNGEALRAEPGQCAIAKPGEPLYAANAHEDRVALAGTDACEPPPRAVLGAASDRFSPTDVAAAAIPLAVLGAPPEPGDFWRDSCDDPGAGCLAAGAGGGVPVVEQPPVGGCFPGAVCDVPVVEQLPVGGPFPGAGGGAD